MVCAKSVIPFALRHTDNTFLLRFLSISQDKVKIVIQTQTRFENLNWKFFLSSRSNKTALHIFLFQRGWTKSPASQLSWSSGWAGFYWFQCLPALPNRGGRRNRTLTNYRFLSHSLVFTFAYKLDQTLSKILVCSWPGPTGEWNADSKFADTADIIVHFLVGSQAMHTSDVFWPTWQFLIDWLATFALRLVGTTSASSKS